MKSKSIRSTVISLVTMFFGVTCLIFCSQPICFGQAKAEPASRPIIIFKFDDLTDRSQLAFQRVADILYKNNCKGGFGIIARSCEGGDEKKPYFDRVKKFHDSGIEIWAHGYDHFLSGDTLTEFLGMPYHHQYEHFKKSLELVHEKLGIRMRTFGAPGNRSDATTVSVMNQFPQIEIFLFPFFSDSRNLQLLLTSRVNIERGTGNMEYDYFLKNYEANQHRPYMILQGHPGVWKEKDFEAFISVIDFLKAQGTVFMTPYEYLQHIKS